MDPIGFKVPLQELQNKIPRAIPLKKFIIIFMPKFNYLI